jgi:hypothetical protein
MQRVPVEVGVDGDGGDPEFTTGTDDPDCDFSTIGDEHL